MTNDNIYRLGFFVSNDCKLNDCFSSEDIAYLEEVGALPIIRSLMRDLVAKRPDQKVLINELREWFQNKEQNKEDEEVASIGAAVLAEFQTAAGAQMIPRKVLEEVLFQGGMASANISSYLDFIEAQCLRGLTFEDFISDAFCTSFPKLSTRQSFIEGDADAEKQFWQRIEGLDEKYDKYGFKILRQDVLTGRWTLFTVIPGSIEKSKPVQYAKKTDRKDPRAHEQPEHGDRCPFCRGREEPTEVLRVWPDGTLEEREGLPQAQEDSQKWIVRALRNPFPYMIQPHDFDVYKMPFPGDPEKYPACFGLHANDTTNPNPDHPMYLQTCGVGASEVIVESNVHNGLIGISTAAQVSHSLRAMVARGRTLRSSQSVKQLVYFKQYGSEACGSLVHPHMQVCTLPIISGYLKSRLQQHRDFFARFGTSATKELYVDTVCQDGIAGARLVRATQHFVASCPYAKPAKGRVVIAPRRHCPRFEDCTEEELVDLGAMLQFVMAAIYRVYDDPPYNLFWESAPTVHALDEPADVEKTFCWSLHVRVPHSTPGFSLASGVQLTSFLPEDEAKKLREAIAAEEILPFREEIRATLAKEAREASASPSISGEPRMDRGSLLQGRRSSIPANFKACDTTSI